jgi:hypothetical protein
MARKRWQWVIGGWLVKLGLWLQMPPHERWHYDRIGKFFVRLGADYFWSPYFPWGRSKG